MIDHMVRVVRGVRQLSGTIALVRWRSSEHIAIDAVRTSWCCPAEHDDELAGFGPVRH